jgi:hypothetical protein
MAVVENERMIMAVKACDSVCFTSLWRMVLLLFINAVYTCILHYVYFMTQYFTV